MRQFKRSQVNTTTLVLLADLLAVHSPIAEQVSCNWYQVLEAHRVGRLKIKKHVFPTLRSVAHAKLPVAWLLTGLIHLLEHYARQVLIYIIRAPCKDRYSISCVLCSSACYLEQSA